MTACMRWGPITPWQHLKSLYNPLSTPYRARDRQSSTAQPTTRFLIPSSITDTQVPSNFPSASQQTKPLSEVH